jgi:steroid 5-alpha reductase family enzyme
VLLAIPSTQSPSIFAKLSKDSWPPNDFFGTVIGLSSAVVVLGSPLVFWLLTPIATGPFLINVTGLPMTEERSPKSKVESYRAYPRITSAFFLGASTVDSSPIK